MNKCFEEYKNKHRHDRVFIIANGPSLKDTNLDLLKDEYCIAMNKISLVYEDTEWRPTYYLYASSNVNNPTWGDSWTDSVQKALKCDKTTSFIAERFKNRIDPKDKYSHVNWFDSLSETKPNLDGDLDPSCFSTDIVERIDKSGTSVNIALQMAYWFGFTEVCFVGADLGWVKDTGSTNDPNHFDSSYRADISNPEKANYQMRNVHSLALKKFIERGEISIYNASLKTVLDIYPVIDLEKYLGGEVLVRKDDWDRAKEFWEKPAQYSSYAPKMEELYEDRSNI